jgi:hypothetical protein
LTDDQRHVKVDIGSPLEAMLAARERAVAANEALQGAATRAGDDMMVDVPLHLEAGEGVGSIRFDRDGKVAGLMLRPASTAPRVDA